MESLFDPMLAGTAISHRWVVEKVRSLLSCQEKATQIVLDQAAVLCGEIVA